MLTKRTVKQPSDKEYMIISRKLIVLNVNVKWRSQIKLTKDAK